MEGRRQIPAIGRLVNEPAIAPLLKRWGRKATVSVLRDIAERFRFAEGEPSRWAEVLEKGLRDLEVPSLRRVINATGVVLHTNLGRAPIAREIASEALDLATGYVNLEFDLMTGKRGSRHRHCAGLLKALTGAEDALIVNNNAAAVVLALHSLASGKEVVLSRGELVEIGGSFRIPDILAMSGARLKEVGTTNRTRFADYQKGVTSMSGAILKVHPSNFRMEGFTEEVAVKNLSRLAKKKRLPLVVDLGTGIVASIPGFRALSAHVDEVLRQGADVVTFSGDKLLGGPQAGIILGKEAVLRKMRQDPWLRILRVDKITLALLESLLRSVLLGRDASIVAKVLGRSEGDIHREAEEFVQKLPASSGFDIRVEQVSSTTGGGSLPGERIPSAAAVFRGSEETIRTFYELLLHGEPPVVPRRSKGKIVFDFRTVLPDDRAVLDRLASDAIQRIRGMIS